MIGGAVPKVETPASGVVVVDAGSGFAHPAIDAGFAQLIEVWRLRRLAMPWVVFGVYPLAAWAAFYLVPFDNFARRVAGDAFHPLLGVYHELFLVIVRVALCWLVFYWFYRRGISIRL